MTATMSREWITDDLFEVGNIRFAIAPEPEQYLAIESSPDSFVLAKARHVVEHLVEIVDVLRPDRVVDIGIFKGGSTALVSALRPSAAISSIDISAVPVRALEDFINANDLGDLVRPVYGVDQADSAKISRLIDSHHGNAPLDLVLDDASHLYRESRRSFEVLFPRLRPGGLYVIEDWAWAHFPEELWQDGGGWFHDRPALTNLVVEVMLSLGTDPSLVAEIRVRHNYVEIVRGPAAYSSGVRLEDHYLNRGLPYRPLI